MLSSVSNTSRMALRHTLSNTTRRGPSVAANYLLSPTRRILSSSSTTTTLPPSIKKSIIPNFTSKQLATYGLVTALAAQSFFGSASDFYEYRFVVKKDIDPDDLASFYGSEEFMDIFCMFPIVSQLMMRGGTFDDNGVVHTYGIPIGEMLVSMVRVRVCMIYDEHLY